MATTPATVQVELSARAGQVSLVDTTRTPVYRYVDRAGSSAPVGLAPLVFELEVGDRLVVPFHNELEEATTIHWHGLRLPNVMDGNPFAGPQGHTGGGVAPGAAFTYEYEVKDVGLFWFHPHVRSDEQVDKGLYGLIRVRPRGTPVPSEDEERLVILDDADLDEQGQFRAPADGHDLIQLGRGGATMLLNGRVSERRLPLSRHTLLRLVNVANGRFFHLTVPGHVFRVMGTDGGRYPEPYTVDALTLVPGERIDVYLVAADGSAAAADVDLFTEPFNRGHGSGLESRHLITPLHLTDAPPPSTSAAPPPTLAPTQRVRIVLGQTTVDGAPGFTINDAGWPDVPTVAVALGSTQELEVINDSTGPHPFHLHGFFFQILERDGVPEPAQRRVWKDTVLVPKGATLLLAATFDEAGLWMYHCHILEHAEHGMMGHLRVE